MMQSGGLLKIKVFKAKLKRDTEFFGDMDPYVVFTVDKKKVKTSVHENGGKRPNWKGAQY